MKLGILGTGKIVQEFLPWLVSHKPFAAERYFITSSSIWQVFFAENYDFSFLFSLFCQ